MISKQFGESNAREGEVIDDAASEMSLVIRELRDDIRPKLVLSDFDLTLCDEYGSDEQGQRVPRLNEDIVNAARALDVIVATSRRAEHPWLPQLWSLGLVRPTMPVIAENGGVIVQQSGKGVVCTDLVDPKTTEGLKDWVDGAARSINDMPAGFRLEQRLGRTMLIVRVQDDNGATPEKQQIWLHDRLIDHGLPEGIEIISSKQSLSIQAEGVSKASAFRVYLNSLDRLRHEVCVIGIGDANNDLPIFEEADVSVGVHESVKSHVKLSLRRGVLSTLSVLRALKDEQELRESVNLDDALMSAREFIDLNTAQRLQWLAERFEVTRKQVGPIKKCLGLPSTDLAREAAQFDGLEDMAMSLGVPKGLASDIERLIIAAAVREHRHLLGEDERSG